MIATKQKYLSISEFAKLCGVSRQTLIFYDKTGIFSPKCKDENNYRYYTLDQYNNFDLLYSLKEIGVPLETIKTYMDSRTPNVFLNLLSDEHKKVQQKIDHLKDISKKIENAIERTYTGLKYYESNKPFVKHCEPEYLFVSNKLDLEHFMSELVDFINLCSDSKIKLTNPIGAIVKFYNLEDNLFGVNFLFTQVDLTNITNKSILTEKKAGIYACINHKGTYSETKNSYKKLLDFINSNNYKIIGDSYETSLLDFLSFKEENDYLTEISIPISTI
ncbi:MerR family transcriptional regulator [uncultured Clostridium sp.]|jgi:DNA-binding transcriptional MerR regulator|uniref:MerR family transcriptional regulator n=1 Tax=uncultured Clostridium sp. TaxID=59620 RepID=UPI00262707BB|nr:MerR family transcriptional regulator [uncultured Clostridium sp.]